MIQLSLYRDGRWARGRARLGRSRVIAGCPRRRSPRGIWSAGCSPATVGLPKAETACRTFGICGSWTVLLIASTAAISSQASEPRRNIPTLSGPILKSKSYSTAQ